MVYEFTELQGVMGYYYALKMGEDEKVALGIKEQYYPLSETGELPSNIHSAIVSIACKFDLIFALFSINMIPSGSKDPYALRRASIGILRIIQEFDLDIDLKDIFDKLAPIYEKSVNYESIKKFFYERFAGFMNVNKSAINAVLATNESNLNNIIKKVNSLAQIISQDSFKKNFSFIKRITNILNKDIHISEVKSELFETKYEHNLYDNFIKVKNENFDTYFDKLEALFSLEAYLSDFFDNVLVNSENEKIKINRISLLNEINIEFRKIADIKMISKD
jgi:glycyl-tRNA synthetase beta chain